MDAAAPGSIADTVARLALWCRHADQGFIRAIFHDGRAREETIRQLEEKLRPRGTPIFRLDLPVAASADALALRLAEELSRLGPGVVSLSGFELSLPTSGSALEAALLALNSRRENFAIPGQHTIWWFPQHVAQALIREQRDLNSWFLRRLELTERLSSPAEIELASLQSEAMRLHNAASYPEAETLLRQIVAGAETSFGHDHPRLATALNDLAILLHQTNRLAEAESLFRRALAMRERSFGPVSLITALTLNSLATLLQATSRTSEAEPLFRRALAILEESLGSSHPDVAGALNNLADLLHETGRAAEAERLWRDALAIQEATLGSNHPDVAVTSVNLGGLLLEAKKFDEAERLLRRALSILEESFGPNHPNVASNLNFLASLLQATNRSKEAEHMMRRAVAIDEAILGPSHPDVANRLHNLGRFLLENGPSLEAKFLLRRSLSILAASTTNAGHPVTGLEIASRSYRRLLRSNGVKRTDAEQEVAELLVENGLSRKKAKLFSRI